jgi:hypothetical protein
MGSKNEKYNAKANSRSLWHRLAFRVGSPSSLSFFSYAVISVCLIVGTRNPAQCPARENFTLLGSALMEEPLISYIPLSKFFLSHNYAPNALFSFILAVHACLKTMHGFEPSNYFAYA